MKLPDFRLTTLVICLVLSLTGCKRRDLPTLPSASPPPQPAAITAAPVGTVPPSTAALEFSVDQVALSTVALPPFPLLSFPDALPENFRQNDQNYGFEEAYVIAGSTLRKVEGRITLRLFPNAAAELSASAARRSYQLALERLGAVKVNRVMPTDPQLVSKEGGDIEKMLAKMRLPDAGPRFENRGVDTYDCYLVRTAQGNTWVTVTTDSLNTFLMTVQEKPLRQSVHALTAESIAATLKTDGHLALHLSFDHDELTLRPDSTPVLSEVVKMMRADPALRLRVEGHTDNLGSAAHNQTLSAGRANTVKAALVAQQIDSARLEAQGFGASRPVADNADESGRVKNRRVELVKL